MKWETAIGLEVHMELSAKSKIFCSCPVSFGGGENTRCCPVCLGLPGTMPNLSGEVLRFAVMACLALECNISRKILFDRKNYFYPDLPKAYQITQHRSPIGFDGAVTLQSGNKIRIEELHMEEDAGKLIHAKHETVCDYNRCGVPLLEIVTAPDFKSADEVVDFLESLRRIFRYLDISDGKIQEGSMRADVNVSVHRTADELGQRVEIKNMSSFNAIKRAIAYESMRQIKIIESGENIAPQTRGWNEENNTTFLLRSKENAQDYRYFPEPDIPCIVLEESMIDEIKRNLPELPNQKAKKYCEKYGLGKYEADILTAEIEIAEFFEESVRCGAAPSAAANWILREVMTYLNAHNASFKTLKLSASSLAQLIELTESKKINRLTAGKLFTLLCENDIDIELYIEENNLWQTNNKDEIAEITEAVISEQPKAVSDFRQGKQKALGYLIGQCMKKNESGGNAEEFKRLLIEKLG